jgi:uncharacterized membrane protein (DUF106 family)
MKLLEFISKFFDFVLSPFSGMSSYVGLTILSVVTGIVMIFLYKVTTDQKKLKQVKEMIKIHFLEIRLFKDDMSEMFAIQKNILKKNFTYLRYTLKSAVVLIIPILFIIIDMNVRYSYRPVQPGESFVVSAVTENAESLERIELLLSPGLTLEVPSMRVPDEKRVSWVIRAGASGVYELAFNQGEDRIVRDVVVSRRIQRIQPLTDKKGDSWTSRLIPEAMFLPEGSPIQNILVEYPERDSFLGLQPGWLYYFFIVSMAAGLVVKKWMGLA